MGERRGTKALELWCRRMIEGYPGVKIDNMTTSWRDGLAFCAMVHHFRPDLIDFDKLNKADVYYNNELAFRTAEIHLGIPALLDAADMESYEVPDRLSILTYLSQYYQTFASQVGSGGNGGSVLKREPCQKCNLPVFLAERLVLGKKLFHRTCLKCARCQSQLTPGSFYETEVDGEFCCETCPDEEKEFALKERLKGDVTVNDDGNKSFTEKLAIFQTDGKGLLQKSLSDEEKSKSLKRLTEFYSNQDQTYKTNKALSSFINNQVDTDPSITSTSSIKSDDSSSSSDDESDNEDPPDLPTTKPPTPPCIPDIVSDQTTSLETSQLNNSKVEIDKDDPQPLNKESPSDVISDIRKYEDDDTKRDEIFEKNVKSETDCENEVPTNGVLGDSTDVDLRNQNESEETFECEKSENKTNEDELVRRKNEIQLDESVDSTPTESNPPDVEFVEIVVPVPRKRHSRNPKEEEETAKPIPVKRGAKAKKASNQTAENNATFVKDVNLYPLDLNPFGSDDDDEEENTTDVKKIVDKKPEVLSSNPFDSSDDEVELEKDGPKKRNVTKDLSKSRISLNPFGSDTEDDEDDLMDKHKRTPVPTPRKVVTSSLNSTPEPTPRLSRAPYNTNPSCNIYGSEASLSSTNTNIYRTSDFSVKNNYLHGSTNSLASSSGSAQRRKKCRAPLPPAMLAKSSNELSVSKENSPTHSTRTSPSPRKKRPAPAPPSSTPKHTLQPIPSIVADSLSDLTTDETIYVTAVDTTVIDGATIAPKDSTTDTTTEESLTNDNITTMRLIPLEASLLEDSRKNSVEHQSIDESDSVVFRRRIVPYTSESATDDSASYNDKSMNVTDDLVEQNARQWQKMKENKETQNKNRQSQISLSSPEPDHIYSNKSSYGKWKRRKGPAPALPVPPRKILQMVPLQEIRHELEVIEVQQLGLEKQGVMLEKMIRERCEGTDPQFNEFGEPQLPPDTPNTKEVEDLILQLFELVNEKNELFRRQAELMYLRRQHRLEQEQADIEYEIRVLMAQPERNKTDCDKAREEALITRLVEVVQLRNEVIECLEMDRLREAEEGSEH
ncbi:hypothetical protein HA402_008686 [Bradysia odoriphaga]|nr:hypothetical protein HA402_008686 [Bradysia odoriphaga]